MGRLGEKLARRRRLAKKYRRLDGEASHDTTQPPLRQVAAQATIWTILSSGQPVKMVEIGSWCGFSAALWAESISRFGTSEQIRDSEILCIDLWQPYFGIADINRDQHYQRMDFAARTGRAFEVFCHNASVAEKEFGVRIRHRKGRSKDVMPELNARAYNLVYIDGSHYYDDVKVDIEEADRIVTVGGYVSGDDLERQVPDVPLSCVEAELETDTAVHQGPNSGFHPGVTLAVHQFFGRVSSYAGYWIMRRMDEGYVPVSLSSVHHFVPSYLGKTNGRRFWRAVSAHTLATEPGIRSFAQWLLARI